MKYILGQNVNDLSFHARHTGCRGKNATPNGKQCLSSLTFNYYGHYLFTYYCMIFSLNFRVIKVLFSMIQSLIDLSQTSGDPVAVALLIFLFLFACLCLESTNRTCKCQNVLPPWSTTQTREQQGLQLQINSKPLKEFQYVIYL